MNKVNVIKQNLEFIGKTWIKYIGTFASILSLFFLFWTWDDIRITSTRYKCVIIILLCVLALILAILWTCIFKRTKTIWESPSGKIKVCYSDIMKDGFNKKVLLLFPLIIATVPNSYTSLFPRSLSSSAIILLGTKFCISKQLCILLSISSIVNPLLTIVFIHLPCSELGDTNGFEHVDISSSTIVSKHELTGITNNFSSLFHFHHIFHPFYKSSLIYKISI